VVHNNVNVFARRAVLDLERPSGPIVTERTLRRGDEGDDVKAMQEALNKKGRIQVKVDGSFGPDMEEAVREFQSKAGLGVDGEIGAQTREKLRV
jgi:peptidoglycan hydrolase-like protein with peptidoglycan-binding domain